MKLAYQTITWGGVVGHPAGVTSVKDLYYVANGSVEQALADIASAGYEGCELFDGNIAAFADDLTRLRDLLAANDLTLVATYSGANFVFRDVLGDELWRIERTAAMAAELGAEHLVVGGGAVRAGGRDGDDLQRLAEALGEVETIASRYGLTPSYHPHLGTIVEDEDSLHALMALTTIGLCPDTAHIAAGGADPVQIVQQYGARIPYVHLKDWSARAQRFLPLGVGDLDLTGVTTALDQHGYDGWITVELDDYDGPPVEAARISAAFLAPTRE